MAGTRASKARCSMIDLDLRKRTERRVQAEMKRVSTASHVEKIRDGKSDYREVKVKECKKGVKGEINKLAS